MLYFIASLVILILARILSGSWGKIILLPWVVVTTPILVAAGLANLNLVPSLIPPWAAKTHLVVIAGTISLFLGSFTMKNIKGPLDVASKVISWNEDTVIIVSIMVTAIAIIANSVQFISYGSIPLLSSDPDAARLGASQNGYLNILSALAGPMIPIGALILLTSGTSLKKRTKRMIIALMTIWFVLQALWFARGMLLYPFLTVMILTYIIMPKFFDFKKILASVLLILFLVGGVKVYRDYVRFGNSAQASYLQLTGLDSDSVLLGSAVALYTIVAINFDVLNQYVETVPDLDPHSMGRIIAGNILAYIPGTGKPFTELDFQNKIFQKNEYEFTLTSTFFGVPYLDFGIIGVLVVGFAIGLLYRIAWSSIFEKGDPLSIFFYGCILSMAPFMPFTFLYTSVNFTWLIVSSFSIVFLCQCRIQGVSLFYKKNRLVLH